MSFRDSFRRLATLLPVTLVLVTAAAMPVEANTEIDVRGLVREEFKGLTRELGLALSSYQVRPAAPLGFLRFDAGAELTVVDINKDRTYWQAAVDDPDDLPSMLPVPKLHANVGLPLGLDLGAVYSKIPSSNVEFYGADLKWSVVRGGAVWPALAVRGAYTQLRGVDELDLETKSLDASISKGIPLVSAYLGAGRVWISAEGQDSAAFLGEVSHAEDRVFGGVRLRLGFLSLVGEASFQEVNAYTLRANISF